jgi:hypothetical protein
MLLDTFYQCLEMSIFFVISVFLDNSNSSTVGNENVLLFFFIGAGGVMVCTRWVGLCVTAEKTKI